MFGRKSAIEGCFCMVRAIANSHRNQFLLNHVFRIVNTVRMETMNTKLKAGLLVGAMALTAGLSVPAQARDNAYQNYLNQLYWNSQYNNPYINQVGVYGLNPNLYNNQVGVYGLNPNDPNYFRQAQIIQWQQSQPGGGMMNYGHNMYSNHVGSVFSRWF